MAWNLKNLEASLLIGSTLVEGSTLSEREASQVLAGKTVQGHPVREIRELLNYRAAVEWLMRELRDSPFVSADLLLEFHRRLFQGFPQEAGRWKSHANYTFHSDGSRHDYAPVSRVPEEIDRWLHRFNGEPKAAPAATAARLYYDFEEIHPFEDGNGRIGRILVAYWLHWKAQRAWSFYLKDKLAHLECLEAANRGDFKPLARFFQRRLKSETRKK